MRGGIGDLSEARAENEYVDTQMRERGYNLVGGQWVGGVAKAEDSAERLEADRACREEKFLREQFRADRAIAAAAKREAAWGSGTRLGGDSAGVLQEAGLPPSGDRGTVDGQGRTSLLRRLRHG